MTHNFSAFSAYCLARGLQAIDHGNGHWQVTGGPLLVSFYPFGKKGPKIYVARTTKGRLVTSLAEVVAATRELPKPGTLPRVKRKNGSGRYLATKRKLMRKDPRCRWCRCPLTLDRSKATDGLRYASIEHLVPLGCGGLENENNYALACEPCNTSRGRSMPETEAES